MYNIQSDIIPIIITVFIYFRASIMYWDWCYDCVLWNLHFY